jgi:hypothetical protein
VRRFIHFSALLIAILALFPLYTRFKVAAAPVPPGVRLGGLEMSALKEPAEIRRHLERIFNETIAVRFADQQLVLRPQDVEFHLDVEQMVAEAGQFLEGGAFLDIALREALGFPQQVRNIPVRFTLNGEKLRAWLHQVAAEQNRPPQHTRLLPAEQRFSDGADALPSLPPGYIGAYQRDWTWLPGAPGYTLDIEASIPRVVAALTSQQERLAELALVETPPPPPGMDDLAQAMNRALANFPGFGAVYVRDLEQGSEARVDDEVAFSGMSTLKIFIAAAVMHRLEKGIQADDPTSSQVGQWLDYALGESNNFAANQLLRFLGDGNVAAGTRVLTQFARDLGFINTYMQSGFDDAALPQLPTPGNQRTDWNTDPDPNLQSTPLEMGRMFTALYECTLGKGRLIETFPTTITADECAQILFYMTHDQFQELVWAGLPDSSSAWIIHKHGFAFETHSDVALVWGPTGPYVISLFLYRAGWMDWGTSNSNMKAISRLVWNFFEFQRSQGQAGAGAPPVFTPPPGYVKIADYLPTAAAGGR